MSSDADVLRARRMLDDMQSKLTESRRTIEETQRQCATAIGASASIDAQWKAIQDKFSLVMATAIGQLSTAFAAELDVSADEKLDSEDRVKQSAAVLAAKIRAANGKTIVFTGAGISTASGIADYRSGMETSAPAGPGAWTIEAMEKTTDSAIAKPKLGARQNVERLDKAKPSFTHRALTELVRRGLVSQVISQNIDGLHRKSGLAPSALIELHGNAFIELCRRCDAHGGLPKVYERSFPVYHTTLTAVGAPTFVPVESCKQSCARHFSERCHCTGRACTDCGEALTHSIVHFGESLRADVVEAAWAAATAAELCIVLGSSCRVAPASNLPASVAQHGDLAMINLQLTGLDRLCSVRVHTTCDTAMRAVLSELGINPDRV